MEASLDFIFSAVSRIENEEVGAEAMDFEEPTFRGGVVGHDRHVRVPRLSPVSRPKVKSERAVGNLLQLQAKIRAFFCMQLGNSSPWT